MVTDPLKVKNHWQRSWLDSAGRNSL